MGKLQKLIEHLKRLGAGLYRTMDHLSGGVLSVFADSASNFNRTRGPEAAASMAYYTIFSLFPLLLSIIAIGSFFIESARLQSQVLELIRLVIPVSPDLISENIQEVLEERGAFGITGVVGLLWAASAAFTTLFRNINRAWHRAAPLNILRSRLVAVALIVALVLLLIMTRFASAFINLLPDLGIVFGDNGSFYDTYLWLVISNLVPLFVTFFIFLGLFRWIPNTKVLWSEAFWAALLAAFGWELTTNIFTLYLSSGLVQYHLVYGSLGTMIALLFWIYLNNMIIIFCAHLSAAIARKNRPSVDRTPDSEQPLSAN